MNMLQTSRKAIGQVYLPAVNWILHVAVLVAVLGFGSSTKLASAYGVAVTGTMLATTILTFFVIRYGWGYNLALSILATGFFAAVDLAFFSSSLLKIAEGGWFPLSLGAAMLMLTWRRGRETMIAKQKASSIGLRPFLDGLVKHPPQRVPGTAVFIVADADVVPRSLMNNLAHNKVLHERVVFVTVTIEEIPHIPLEERASVESLGNGCWRVKLKFGFSDRPDVPEALQTCARHRLPFDIEETSFFLSSENIVSTPGAGMLQWRERLFSAMARNEGSPVDYFHLPANRVIELGTQVEI